MLFWNLSIFSIQHLYLVQPLYRNNEALPCSFLHTSSRYLREKCGLFVFTMSEFKQSDWSIELSFVISLEFHNLPLFVFKMSESEQSDWFISAMIPLKFPIYLYCNENRMSTLSLGLFPLVCTLSPLVWESSEFRVTRFSLFGHIILCKFYQIWWQIRLNPVTLPRILRYAEEVGKVSVSWKDRLQELDGWFIHDNSGPWITEHFIDGQSMTIRFIPKTSHDDPSLVSNWTASLALVSPSSIFLEKFYKLMPNVWMLHSPKLVGGAFLTLQSG